MSLDVLMCDRWELKHREKEEVGIEKEVGIIDC